MTDFRNLPRKAQLRLARISASVSDVVPKGTKLWKIQARFLAEGDGVRTIVNEVRAWCESRCGYLYTIRIASENVDPSSLVDAYLRARATEKGIRAYARLNQNRETAYLYVGSSKKIEQRLKDHLGFGARGTYALHLACWASSMPIELEFGCAKYPPGTSTMALQALEDTLWEDLLPMFGRQGRR